jgi:hypothetical protein
MKKVLLVLTIAANALSHSALQGGLEIATEEAQLVAGDAEPHDAFGYSVPLGHQRRGGGRGARHRGRNGAG